MVLKPVKDVIHFSYCLSVAVKINRKYSAGLTVIHTNIFIMKWLEEAQKNKSYRRIVHCEITGSQDISDPMARFIKILRKLLIIIIKQAHY